MNNKAITGEVTEDQYKKFLFLKGLWALKSNSAVIQKLIDTAYDSTPHNIKKLAILPRKLRKKHG